MSRGTVATVRLICVWVLVASVYAAAGKLGLLFATTQQNVTLVWVPSGVALVAVLLGGYRLWPGVALGAFLVNLTTPVPLAVALAITVGNTLEALAGAALLRRAGFDKAVSRVSDVLALVGLAAALATTVSATVGVTALWASGVAEAARLPRLWLIWWSGDALGVLLVTPFVLSWAARPKPNWTPAQAAELAALVAGMSLAGFAIFFWGGQPDTEFGFVFFPFVMWAAIRFGQREAVSLTLLAAAIAVGGVAQKVRFDEVNAFEQQYFSIHAFLGVAAVSAMLLAAMLAERARGVEELRRSAALLGAVAEGTTDAVFVKDVQGRYLLFNEAAARFVGLPADEVIGKDDTELFDPDGARAVMIRDREVMDTGRSSTAEEVLTAAGVTRTFLSTKAPYRDDRGVVIGLIGVSRDLTERKRGEQALRESEARFRALVETLPDAVFVNVGGRVVFCNPACVRLFGATADAQILGKTPFELYTPEYHEIIRGRIAAIRATRAPVPELEEKIIRIDGGTTPVLVTALPIDDGVPDAVLVVLRDLTEQKRMEAQLRQQEMLIREAAEMAHVGGWGFDPHTLKGDWTAETARIYDLPPSHQPDAVTSLAFYDAEDRPRIEAAVRAAIESGKPFDLELRFVSASGTRKWVRAICRPVVEGGKVVRVRGSLQDVTQRKKAEETLLLRDRAMQAAPVGILIADASRPDHPIVYASPGFERMTGYSALEALGRNCRFLQGEETDPEAVRVLRHALHSGSACDVEFLNYRKDGTSFWNELSISPVRDGRGRLTHFVGVQADVTARRKLEEQYRQAQKMEAVGRLAGGVAHDFNNLLLVIGGYGDLVLSELPAEGMAKQWVEEMVHAGERAAALTRQLLAFSRRQVVTPEVLDLNAVLRTMQPMMARLIGEDVLLSAELSPDVPPVRADRSQIEQVVMNLAVNARDAMPSGGTLTLRTGATGADVGQRPHVVLSVSDTGQGMTPEVMARVFEPFFTTKEVGKGTGLGLAVVHGIVEQSGGRVAVRSEPGMGTTFEVYLPATDDAVSAEESAQETEIEEGEETILLVEDDQAVLDLALTVLRARGYAVLPALGGEEALRLSGEWSGRIDLLVTDVVMPKMGGRAVAETLARREPSVKVLYVSGYPDDALVRSGVEREEVNFLQKPYSPHSLACKVREILDRRPRDA